MHKKFFFIKPKIKKSVVLIPGPVQHTHREKQQIFIFDFYGVLFLTDAYKHRSIN